MHRAVYNPLHERQAVLVLVLVQRLEHESPEVTVDLPVDPLHDSILLLGVREGEFMRRPRSKQEFADEIVGKVRSSVRTDLVRSTEPAEVFKETAASVNSCGGFAVIQLCPS